jgi:hypothetical protein
LREQWTQVPHPQPQVDRVEAHRPEAEADAARISLDARTGRSLMPICNAATESAR